jgi:hypothetical protein
MEESTNILISVGSVLIIKDCLKVDFNPKSLEGVQRILKDLN